jgi:hypothetical protein
MNFNKELFLENTKKRRLTSGEALMFDSLKQADVRNVIDLDGTYEYDIGIGRYTPFKNTDDNKVILRKALDVIYNDVVGQTLLKLLIVKRRLSGRKIGLVNYPGNGSCYDEIIEAVFVNLSLYQPDGSGIQERRYYSVNSDGKIELKQKSLEKSIFHELTHGLHYISDGKYADTALCLQSRMMKEIWSEDEELRTITGHMFEKLYDPVCDHVFDYSLHGDPFCPRYGHIGWSDGGNGNPPILATNLINQMKYLGEWKKYQLPDPLPPLRLLPVSRKVQHTIGRRMPPTLPANPTITKLHIERNLPKL